MPGFDLLISDINDLEEIKLPILKVFDKTLDEACFYRDVGELTSSLPTVNLQVGFYPKSGSVSCMISIEHDNELGNEVLAGRIANSLSRKCYLPDDNSPSYEAYLEFLPNSKTVRKVKLVEDDSGDSFRFQPSD